MSEVEIDEDALFDGAVSGEETPDTPVVTEQVAPIEPEQTEAVAAEEAEIEAPAAEKPAGQVPSFRLKQEAEARRLLETDLANERADKAALRQRLEALEKPAPKVEPTTPARPDPLLDPEGYATAIREEVRQEQLAERREESLIRARESNQTEFDEAYAAAQKAVDPALKARMQSSRDPGKTLLEWHRESKARAEVGTDLNAYKAKLREEALKDPEFRKAAMEAWRTDAQPQVNGRPRIDLPPTLNGASRSNAALSVTADANDDELFEQITG